MKLFLILRYDSDDCTYCSHSVHSTWTDDVKCLKALEELKRRYPERPGYFWWDITEEESDPKHLDEYGPLPQ